MDTRRSNPSSRLLAGLASLALGATMLAGATGTAIAHPGHENEPGAEQALDWSAYQKVVLTRDTGEPIDMAILPDLRVLHTARNGDVRLTDPATGVTRVINQIPVYNNSEDGLQTIELAPDFETSGWVYVYYSPLDLDPPYPPRTPAGNAPTMLPAGQTEAYWDQWKGYNQVSRFQWDAAESRLDLASEQVILRVPVERGQCCHLGTDMGFDADGNLYLATGDNTPAGAPGANGYAPNNDAPGMNPGLDARRASGNTNDLRGKILRVTPGEDGGYTIPEGNLFPPGTAQTRPEIWAMGLRNPFRMEVDPVLNVVHWADYGPDAGAANAQRGPMGLVEWQTSSIDRPANYGWPFCTGDNFNYNDWDFATATPGPWFDCTAGAINTSRWNTGLEQVPPAIPATAYYGDNPGDQPWDEFVTFSPRGGQGPMAGPVYHYDADNPSPTKFPQFWDGKAFFAEFSQDYAAAISVDWPNGPISHIENFLPNAEAETNNMAPWSGPIDIEFGPDGSLYVLDYGKGFFRQNPTAALYRIDYTPEIKAPVAVMSTNPRSSSGAPLTVEFDASATVDPQGSALTYEWDFNGDGVFEATGVTATHTYTEMAVYTARLRVTNEFGLRGLTSQQISVGNVAPTVNVETPGDGSFFDWGQAVPFVVSTEDAEDGTNTVCSRVAWTFGLGHDDHAHPLSQGTGCRFAIPTPIDAPEHGETENIFGAVVITYTDGGANGLPPASTTLAMTLNPKLQEGEWADESSGVEIVSDDTASGLRKVTSFDAGDWLAWDPVNLAGIDAVNVRSAGSGALQLRWNAPDAEPFATLAVSGSGWSETTGSLAGAPQGTGVLYVTSTGGVDLDRLVFVGDGVADTQPPVVTYTLNPAQPTGANGWYLGNVVLNVQATDNGAVAARQWSINGGQTWTNTPNNGNVTISAEGESTVLLRARDTGGNISDPIQVLIRIDRTDPSVNLGVESGAEVGMSDDVTFSGADAVSGIGTVVGTVDGEPVEGTTVEAWRLGLGTHTLTVTVTDIAGRSTTASVEFTVTTSRSDLRSLTERLAADGMVTADGERQLFQRLEQAEKHADGGRVTAAMAQLESFVDHAGQARYVSDAAARAALVEAAEDVISQLHG